MKRTEFAKLNACHHFSFSTSLFAIGLSSLENDCERGWLKCMVRHALREFSTTINPKSNDENFKLFINFQSKLVLWISLWIK